MAGFFTDFKQTEGFLLSPKHRQIRKLEMEKKGKQRKVRGQRFVKE